MNNSLSSLISVFILALCLMAGVYFIPWHRINWGKLEIMPSATITVIGEAKTEQLNEIASFSVGVEAIHDDKDTAINDVNQKTAGIINAVKNFGVEEQDIQTQNLSVYQREESYWEGDRQKSRKGQWFVNNSINITLRQAEKASELTQLLSQSGANNIYGPSFRLDDTQETSTQLLEKAMINAQEKAEKVAENSHRSLGKIISVSEGGKQSSYPYAAYAEIGAGGGGAPVEAGSSTVFQSVVVVYELK